MQNGGKMFHWLRCFHSSRLLGAVGISFLLQVKPQCNWKGAKIFNFFLLLLVDYYKSFPSSLLYKMPTSTFWEVFHTYMPQWEAVTSAVFSHLYMSYLQSKFDLHWFFFTFIITNLTECPTAIIYGWLLGSNSHLTADLMKVFSIPWILIPYETMLMETETSTSVVYFQKIFFLLFQEYRNCPCRITPVVRIL